MPSSTLRPVILEHNLQNSSSSMRLVTPAKNRVQPMIKKQDYIEYDFSTMKNSYGGFINSDDELPHDSSKQETFHEWQQKQSERKALYDHEVPPEHISLAPKCQECKFNIELDPIINNVFHLKICKSCVRSNPEKYSLLTKTECKDDYFLTDPELNDLELFDRLEKPNPYSGTFARMQLFLRCQIEQYAFNKWGGEKGLDDEWLRREESKVVRQKKKYQQKIREMRLKTRSQEYTERLQIKKYGRSHIHKFSEPVDIGTDDNGFSVKKRRCVECGLESEEISL